MVKSIGIDPGTKSLDLYGFDDESGGVILDLAIPRSEVTKDPKIVLEALEGIEADCIVGPAGYGMPLKRAKDASDEDILEATFMTQGDVEKRLNLVGLRELMFLMRDSDLPIWFPPGVVHLPTVPEYRKANKVDLGSADKTSTVVVGIKDEAEHLGVDFSETAFIILEIGFGYTSAMAVDKGKVVDGVGGTCGGPGFMSSGGFDSEIAFAVANSVSFPKMLLFKGGAAAIAGIDPLETSVEDFVSMGKKETQAGYTAMLEAALKDVMQLLPSVENPKEVLFSGRFPRIPAFRSDLSNLIEKHTGISCRQVQGKGGSKQAAEGAAVLGNGLAGGKYSSLVENMEIKKSSGSLFSHLYFGEEITEKIRETFTRR